MPSNQEAFEELNETIDEKGKRYCRSDLVSNYGNRNREVAIGLEKTGIVQTQHAGIEATLSVRGLRILSRYTDDLVFKTKSGWKKEALWQIKSTLRVGMPEGNSFGINAGEHVCEADYLLKSEAPQFLDEKLDLIIEVGCAERLIREHMNAEYNQFPLNVEAKDPNSSRSKFLRSLIRNPDSPGGMAMLSPTDDGIPNELELPIVIGWLLS